MKGVDDMVKMASAFKEAKDRESHNMSLQTSRHKIIKKIKVVALNRSRDKSN
jgi:hypothetical protein